MVDPRLANEATMGQWLDKYEEQAAELQERIDLLKRAEARDRWLELAMAFALGTAVGSIGLAVLLLLTR